jgi:hypothetical protein
MLANASDQLSRMAEKAQLAAVSQNAPDVVEYGRIRVKNSHVRGASRPARHYGFSECSCHQKSFFCQLGGRVLP